MSFDHTLEWGALSNIWDFVNTLSISIVSDTAILHTFTLLELFLSKNHQICLQALRKISQRTKLGQKWVKLPPLRAKIACFVREGAIIMAEDEDDDDGGVVWGT